MSNGKIMLKIGDVVKLYSDDDASPITHFQGGKPYTGKDSHWVMSQGKYYVNGVRYNHEDILFPENQVLLKIGDSLLGGHCYLEEISDEELMVYCVSGFTADGVPYDTTGRKYGWAKNPNDDYGGWYVNGVKYEQCDIITPREDSNQAHDGLDDDKTNQYSCEITPTNIADILDYNGCKEYRMWTYKDGITLGSKSIHTQIRFTNPNWLQIILAHFGRSEFVMPPMFDFNQALLDNGFKYNNARNYTYNGVAIIDECSNSFMFSNNVRNYKNTEKNAKTIAKIAQLIQELETL